MHVEDGLSSRGPLAVALGPFDSLHRGQRARLEALVERASRHAQPVAVLEPAAAPEPAVWPTRMLRDQLAAAGVQRLVRAPVASHAEIEDWLCTEAGLLALPTPDDAEHGELAARLATLGDAPWRTVHAPTRSDASTAALVDALARGAFARAEALLGAPYALAGEVAHGDQLGRRLGVPTANVQLGGPRLCVRGVYAALVQVEDDGREHEAMAYVGVRPSVGGAEQRLEAHLLDYDGDLYGRRLAVRPLAKVADEEILPSLEALRRRIHENLARVRAHFDGPGT